MERVPLFANVIDEYIEDSIFCRMNLADLKEAQRRFESYAATMRLTPNWGLWGNHYYFSFRVLLDSFHREREKFDPLIPINEKVDFIFDERNEKRPILEAWDEILENLEEDTRSRFGATPRFENDQVFLPLQAADFWAWWVREWYEEEGPINDTDQPTKLRNFEYASWRGLKPTWKGKNRRFIAVCLTEDKIFENFQRITAHNLEAGNFIAGQVF
jgi:hypothetical protein